MAPTAADVLIEAIQDRGVEVVFGLPGDGINGIVVLAIPGMPYHDLIGTHTQQDVALDQLFADVAKFNQRIMGVAHLTFPVDIQEMDAGAYGSKRNIKHHTSDVYARSARLPAEDTTGSIGLLGTNPSQEALEECDTLLIVGSSFPHIEFLPKPGQARGVQIELDLRRKTEREFLESARERMKDWLELV